MRLSSPCSDFFAEGSIRRSRGSAAITKCRAGVAIARAITLNRSTDEHLPPLPPAPVALRIHFLSPPTLEERYEQINPTRPKTRHRPVLGDANNRVNPVQPAFLYRRTAAVPQGSG